MVSPPPLVTAGPDRSFLQNTIVLLGVTRRLGGGPCSTVPEMRPWPTVTPRSSQHPVGALRKRCSDQTMNLKVVSPGAALHGADQAPRDRLPAHAQLPWIAVGHWTRRAGVASGREAGTPVILLARLFRRTLHPPRVPRHPNRHSSWIDFERVCCSASARISDLGALFPLYCRFFGPPSAPEIPRPPHHWSLGFTFAPHGPGLNLELAPPRSARASGSWRLAPPSSSVNWDHLQSGPS